MQPDFKTLVSKKSTRQLLITMTFERDRIAPAELRAVEEEFRRRNLSDADIQKIILETDFTTIQVNEQAKEPLGVVFKILAFVFPGLLLLSFSARFKTKGYSRKVRELRGWTLYGIGFYTLLMVLVEILLIL